MKEYKIFTDEDMLTLLKAEECPMDVSITKWEIIVQSLKDGRTEDAYRTFVYGSENCALCYTHDKCQGCPIKVYNGVGNCDYTPYTLVSNEMEDIQTSGICNSNLEWLISYSEDMIKFLQDVKKFQSENDEDDSVEDQISNLIQSNRDDIESTLDDILEAMIREKIPDINDKMINWFEFAKEEFKNVFYGG